MSSNRWDAIAASFDREVFDPLASDLYGTIGLRLRKLAPPDATVADLGCGVGRTLPTLSELFQRVIAVDLSKRCLEVARRRCRRLGNIEFVQKDLTRPLDDLGPVQAAVSINVALTMNHAARSRLFRNVAAVVPRGSPLLLVVPSLESALLAQHRLTLWNLEDHDGFQRASLSAAADLGITTRTSREGAVRRGDVATKHYLLEELEILLESLGHEIVSVDKVEYGWQTEFDDPPASLGEPYPWDWLVVSRLVRR